jgi:hypothetical protein
MASTLENLQMIADIFLKGMEVLEILRDQLLKDLRFCRNAVFCEDQGQIPKPERV